MLYKGCVAYKSCDSSLDVAGYKKQRSLKNVLYGQKLFLQRDGFSRRSSSLVRTPLVRHYARRYRNGGAYTRLHSVGAPRLSELRFNQTSVLLAGINEQRMRSVRFSELGAAVVLFSVLCMQLFIRLSVIEACYKLESLRKEALVADADLRELRLMHAWKTQPSTIILRSREMLNMSPSIPSQIRRVSIGDF